ncbi:Uncharacterised protein [Mycobacteroides abscessus subsp. abscessus]|nr:Uncharacterised protein [Mycobacteroides abscessus subsp. abscessus]
MTTPKTPLTWTNHVAAAYRAPVGFAVCAPSSEGLALSESRRYPSPFWQHQPPQPSYTTSVTSLVSMGSAAVSP